MKRIIPKADLWLIAAVVAGSLLRLLFLNNFPSGFHFDEAQSGYNGYLISQHLKNMHGQFLPTDIDYYGDYRPAASSYLIAPFVKFFGNTQAAERMPFALISILTIVLVYQLTLVTIKNKHIAYLAAFLLAISPYNIIFSRASTDGIIDIFWSLLALIILIKFMQNGSKKLLIVVFLLWILGFFTYQTSRFLTPVLTTLLITVYYFTGKVSGKRVLPVALLIVSYIIFLVGVFSLNDKAQGRFNQVSVFSYPENQRSLNQAIIESGTLGINPLIVRMYHNKVLVYFSDISQRYLSFFAPSVVLYNTTQPVRYKVPNIGMITILEYLGLLMAIYYIIKKKSTTSLFFLGGLLVAPLPSALTFEAFPNFQRAIYLMPFWQILTAFGLYNFYHSIPNKWRKISIITAGLYITWSFTFFLYQYFLISPIHEPFYRNYDQNELARFLGGEGGNYQNIIIPENGTYVYYLYFNNLDVFNAKLTKQGKYYRGNFKLNNLIFIKASCLRAEDLLGQNFDLTINPAGCTKYSFLNKLKEFKWKDGAVSLIAYTPDIPKLKALSEKNQDLIGCLRQANNDYWQNLPDELGLNQKATLSSSNDYNTRVNDCINSFPLRMT